MKPLLIIAMISLFLASCGKSNTTSSGTTTVVNSVSSAVSTTTFTDFQTAVNNGNFIAQSYTSEAYYYNKSSVSQDTILWGLVNVYKSSSSGSMKRTANRTTGVYSHEFGTTAAAIKAGLQGIVSGATYYTPCYSTRNNCYVVYKSASEGYVIDLAYPIGANPLAKVSSSSGYSMVGVQVLAQ